MKRIAVLPFLLFALACADTPTEVSPIPDGLTLAADFQGNAPAESGAVVRFADRAGVGFFDFEKGLLLLVSHDMKDWCTPPVGSAEFEFVSVQDVLLKGDRLKKLMMGEVYTEVWPLSTVDCDYALANDPLAAGMARMMYLDNDFGGAGGADGTDARLNAVARVVINKNKVTQVLKVFLR
jgi:hypothetical protein